MSNSVKIIYNNPVCDIVSTTEVRRMKCDRMNANDESWGL